MCLLLLYALYLYLLVTTFYLFSSFFNDLHYKVVTGLGRQLEDLESDYL